MDMFKSRLPLLWVGLFLITQLPLYGEIKTVEYKRDVYYDSDPQAGVPMDIDYTTPAIWYPTMPTNQHRLNINLVAGANPYYLKGGVKFKFIWDSDSVQPGGSFVVKVVAETDSAYTGDPNYGGSYEIYSAYGFQAGIGLEERFLRIRWGIPTWTSWWETPVGIGIDACLNVKKNGILPMYGESLWGEDEINVASVGADMFAGGKTIRDQHGNPVPKSAQSELLGLINILDLGVRIGYKLQNGVIYAKIDPTWPFSLDPTYHQNHDQFFWMHRGDTVFLHINVDPLATNNDTGYFEISHVYVREDIYHREADYISILGFSATIYQTPWQRANNGYVDLSLDQNFPLIPVPVTGQSLAHVDLYIDPNYLSLWHPITRGNELSFLNQPEVGGRTGVGLKVRNKGNITSHGYVVKFIFPDSTYVEDRRGFVTIPPGGHDDIAWVGPQWIHEGNAQIKVIIIPDSTEHDPNPHNDTLIINVFVRKHRITTLIALIDQTTGDTITPADSMFGQVLAVAWGQGYAERAVPDTTFNYWDRWVAFIPHDAEVNITAIPDSNHRGLYANSTRYVDMDTVSTDPFWIYIPILGKSAVKGTVLDDHGNPAESTQVVLGTFFYAYTDSLGHYEIDNVPANAGISGSPYYVRFYKPGYRIDSIPVYLTNFDTLILNHTLTNIDSIPPVGTVNISNVITKNTVIYFTAMDTFTQFGDTLPPSQVIVRDNGSTWQTFDYGNGFDYSVNWTMHTRTYNNEIDTIWVRFSDLAGNVSDSIMKVVTVDQTGPIGTFSINNGDSSTLNPTISITDVTIESTLVPVKSITIYESGNRTVTYPYSSGSTYSYTLSGSSGNHLINVIFTDSLGVSPHYPVSSAILLDYYGKLTINDDSTFTNSSTVDLTINAIGILASNSTISESFGEYPLAQSFIPHSDRIGAFSICIDNADSGAKVGIYSDTVVDGEHSPYQPLFLDTLHEDVGGWLTIQLPTPISVDSDTVYFIAIFQDSLGEYQNNIHVAVGSDTNYTEGHLYYSPMKKGLYWYPCGYDMGFRVMGAPDSMRISNDPQFATGTGWIPYSSSYPNWNLLAGEGRRTVYAEVKTASQVRSYHDDIIVDTTPPDTGWVTLLNHAPFLETTECTLNIYAIDGGSGMSSYRINNSLYPFPITAPFTVIYNVDSGAVGPRTISVTFKDKAGNEYHPPAITIDYDPSGPSGNVYLGSGFEASETVSVYIDLDKYKNKTVTVDSMKFSTNMRDWTPWMPFDAETSYIFNRVGPVALYVKLLDNYGKTSILRGTCIIDTTPPFRPINVRDEGDLTPSHDSLSFSWTCYGDYESLLDSFVIKISGDPSVQNVLYRFNVPPNVRSYRVGPMNLRGDSTYYAKVVAYNKVGLSSESDPTDGIRIMNGISHFNLISPSDSSTFGTSDTINLIWHQATDILSSITGYHVFIDSQMVATVTDTIWQVDFNLQNGWHWWFVVAADSLLDQRYSDTLHFYVGILNPPPVPQILAPLDTIFNYDTVRFVWSPGVKVFKAIESIARADEAPDKKTSVNYTLQIATDSFFNNVIDTLVTTDTTALMTLPEGHFYWHVRASNQAGTSDWSDPARFAVDTTKPSAPAIISPQNDTLYNDTVTVIWSSSSDNFGIRMYQLNYWGAASGMIEATDTTATLILTTGTFYFAITAFDSACNVAVSDTAWFVIRHILPVPELVLPHNDSMTNNLQNMQFVWRSGSKNFVKTEIVRLRKTLELRNKSNRFFNFQLSLNDSSFTSTFYDDTLADTTLTLNIPEGRLLWRVREVDYQGNSSQWTSPWMLVGDTTGPTSPNLISPPDEDTISGTIHFIWSSSTDTLAGLAGYRLLVADNDSMANPVVDTTLSDTTFTLTSLNYGDWYWMVESFDSVGNMSPSGIRIFHHYAPLPVPTLVSPIGNTWTRSPVTLRWQVSTKDTLSYIVEVMVNGYPLIRDTVSEDSAIVTLPTGSYTWHVRTLYGGRTSDWSLRDSFRVDNEPPTASILLYPGYGYYITSFPYQFSWMPSHDTLSGLAGYRFLIADNPDMMNPEIDTTMMDTTYMLTSIGNGEWYWQVRSYDSAGNVSFSEIAVFYVDTIPPEPVVLIFPEDSSISSDPYGVWFCWHPTEKLVKKDGNKQTFYELYLADSTDTTIFAEISDTSYYYETTLHEGWYTWWVKAYDDAGNWSSSDVWTFAIDVTPPVIESTTIWHDTSFMGPYEIRTRVFDENGLRAVRLFYAFGESPRIFDSLDMVLDTANFYHAFIPQVQDTTTVNYFIYAIDNAHDPNEAYDPEDSIYHFRVILVNVGESDIIPHRFDLSVAPNPAHNSAKLTFSIPKSEDVEIVVYDAGGRAIFKKIESFTPGIKTYELRGNLKEGVYFIKVKAQGKVLIRKLIMLN